MHRLRPPSPSIVRLTALLGLFLLIGPLAFGSGAASGQGPADPTRVYLPLIAGVRRYTQTFDGDPAAPLPWQPADWDIAVHSRDVSTWDELEPMQAHHGPDCAPSPATHAITRYEDAVFICRNHLMTSIQAEGYGVIYLTPNQLVDFSEGEAFVRFDMSTLRTSNRDWVDIWITPYLDNLSLPFDDGSVDLSGPPRNAVHIQMDLSDNSFFATIYRNFKGTRIQGAFPAYDQFLATSATRRDTFELRLSRTHLSFGMPAYNFRWLDTPIPDLGWGQGVVQLGHHSYNPLKDCGSCTANTWHWDNLVIQPVRPFAIIRADRRYVDSSVSAPVRFAQPAPADAHLRFAGIGDGIEVSFDGGATWRAAQLQAQDASMFKDEHFKNYWMPIPAGTREVRFRGQAWWGADWRARDMTIWALTRP